MKRVKGFGAGRKNLIKIAKTADTHAGMHAYRDRRVKKRTARGLWQVNINAAARELGTTYSKFMAALKAGNIALDRKVLSGIADKHPQVFTKIVESVK